MELVETVFFFIFISPVRATKNCTTVVVFTKHVRNSCSNTIKSTGKLIIRVCCFRIENSAFVKRQVKTNTHNACVIVFLAYIVVLGMYSFLLARSDSKSFLFFLIYQKILSVQRIYTFAFAYFTFVKAKNKKKTKTKNHFKTYVHI